MRHPSPVRAAAVAASLALLGGATVARASTGVCDATPPLSTRACIDAVQNSEWDKMVPIRSEFHCGSVRSYGLHLGGEIRP